MIAAAPLQYIWDDNDPYIPLGDPDPQVIEKLEQVSLRAVLAFAVGCAEWVLYRLKNHSDASLPWEYVDAQWAGLFIWKLRYLWDPGHKDKDGPVRGAIDMAMRDLTNCSRALKLAEGQVDAAMIARLAEYVMSDPSVFLKWRDRALERLSQIYPLDNDEPFGQPMPREALDDAVVMTAESGVGLAEAYVRSLDFSKNEFLNAPALPEGFFENPQPKQE